MNPDSTQPRSVLAAAQSELPRHRRIVLLTDGYSTPFLAKTAISLLRYRTADVVAVIDKQSPGKTAQELLHAGGRIPVVASLDEVPVADAIYIGIAPPGGKLPAEWQPLLCQALKRGMDVVSGLHDFLEDNAEYVRLAREHRSRLIDVRRNRHKSIARCAQFRPGCLRIHAVGHDCTVGKMVTTLEMERGLRERGHTAKFLATGQTGIMISGEGVPIDCVVSDFVNGAAEQLVLENEGHDFLLIEGQGSLSHPAYSGVTLGLLHGCAPHGLVFCYEAGRTQVKGLDNIDIPPLRRLMDFCVSAANLRHPCRLIGIAINTRVMTPAAAAEEVARAESEFGLPACDVYRDGPDKLVDAALALRREIVGA